MSNKRLTILAGINGAGKTTLRNEHPELFHRMQVIDSDNYLRAFNGNWRRTSDRLKAISQANQALEGALGQGISIVWEVEMAGSAKSETEMITLARKAGYNVNLIYVTVKDAEISLERVLHRFRNGGFGGTQLNLSERYARVKENMTKLKSLFDCVMIFDNTEQLTCVYDECDGEVTVNKLSETPWAKI